MLKRPLQGSLPVPVGFAWGGALLDEEGEEGRVVLLDGEVHGGLAAVGGVCGGVLEAMLAQPGETRGSGGWDYRSSRRCRFRADRRFGHGNHITVCVQFVHLLLILVPA